MKLSPNLDPIYDALRDASEGYENPYRPNTADHRLYEQAAARHALAQGRLAAFDRVKGTRRVRVSAESRDFVPLRGRPPNKASKPRKPRPHKPRIDRLAKWERKAEKARAKRELRKSA